MLGIIYTVVKQNIVYYAVLIVLFFLLFFFTGMYLDEYIVNGTELSYINSLDDSLKIYSFNAGWDNREVMIDEKRAGHIGYAYQDIVYNDDMQNSNACFAVDSFISKYFLFHARGNGLSFQNGDNEVILYGRILEDHYKIGDMVSLNGVGYKVVGILPYYEPVWGMYSSVSESDTDVLMYALNENMYFINNEKAFQQGDTRLRSVLFAKDDIPGLPGKASMKKIKQKVTEYKKRKQMLDNWSIAMLTGLAIYLCVSAAVIQHKKCRNMYAVFQICGMHFVKYHIICTCLSVLSVFISVLFYFMVYWITIRREYFDIRLDSNKFYFAAGVTFVLVFLSVLLNCTLNRNLVYES